MTGEEFSSSSILKQFSSSFCSNETRRPLKIDPINVPKMLEWQKHIVDWVFFIEQYFDTLLNVHRASTEIYWFLSVL